MNTRVFVTGIGIVSPLGLDAASTWSNLVQGISGVDYISAFDPEKFETHIAAEVKGFDPTEYLEKKKTRRLDRFAQFALVAAQEALWQADLKIEKVDPTRVAAIVGSGIGGIITLSEQYKVLEDRGPNRVSPFLLPMMLADMGPGQISMMFGTKGPNFTTVSSCSSGADAIGEASEMIRRGDVDIAIAGGTEAPICPIAVAGFNACQALSRRNTDPKAASRPFEAHRDGFVMGEGSAILVLESEASVIRRNTLALAELMGYGSSSDAHHITQPAPEGEGAARAMKMALNKSGLKAKEIDYVNAHGTSTPMNDKFETMAMKSIFGKDAYKTAISSTKSMTGHLLGAGGALESAFSVMALNRAIVPPTINLEEQDPDCDLDYTPKEARKQELRIVMSNSFGFGGHNSSLIFRAAEGIS